MFWTVHRTHEQPWHNIGEQDEATHYLLENAFSGGPRVVVTSAFLNCGLVLRLKEVLAQIAPLSITHSSARAVVIEPVRVLVITPTSQCNELANLLKRNGAISDRSSPIQGPKLWEMLVSQERRQQQRRRWRVHQQHQPQPGDQGCDRHVGLFEQLVPTEFATVASRV